VIAEVFDDVGEVLRRGCEVEEAVPPGAELRIDLGEHTLQRVVAGGIIEVHRMIVDAFHERVELGVVLVDTAAADDSLFHIFGKGLLERPPGDADNREVLREKPGLLQVIERGQQLAFGEIARCAEDDNDAGVRRALRLLRRDWCTCFADQSVHLSLLLGLHFDSLSLQSLRLRLLYVVTAKCAAHD
jgi:hypothetical protein